VPSLQSPAMGEQILLIICC